MNTKQQIIELATALMKQKGYKGWSYQDISNGMGIKKASIHYYYPSKENLVLEVVKIYANGFLSKLDLLLKEPTSNLEKLKKLFALYRTSYYSYDEICLCTILSADYHMLPQEVLDCLEHFNQELIKKLCYIFKEGVAKGEFNKNFDCDIMAHLSINTLQGLLITSKFFSGPRVFENCTDQLLKFVKTGE